MGRGGVIGKAVSFQKASLTEAGMTLGPLGSGPHSSAEVEVLPGSGSETSAGAFTPTGSVPKDSVGMKAPSGAWQKFILFCVAPHGVGPEP